MTTTQTPTRPIDQRFLPPVAGVDLAQSLNFIAVDDAGTDFCYDHYTSARLPYRQGDRPVIEAIAKEVTRDCSNTRDAVLALNVWVSENVKWAGFYEHEKGELLAFDKALSEEALIEQGWAWCNEQARVLCCLTQAIGVPSRLVFACARAEGYGHCTTEALLPDGWCLLDQSMGYAFEIEGRPVRAVDVFGDAETRSHFEPIYAGLCRDLIKTLGRDLLEESFRMSTVDNPLDGFEVIGFHNHFLI